MPNTDKQEFLALNEEEQIPYKLSIKEMIILAEYYSKKNIPIIVCGKNDYTKLAIRQHLEGFYSELKYAFAIQKFWCYNNNSFSLLGDKGQYFCINPKFAYSGNKFIPIYTCLKEKIKAFLIREEILRIDLSQEELITLNSLISSESILKAVFDDRIKAYIEYYINRPFYNEDVEKEIQYIANSISPNTSVGYIAKEYGEDTERVHFEAFIINKKEDMSIEVVKPVNWPYATSITFSIPEMYQTNLFYLIKTDKKTIPAAQNSSIECGTLSLMYLKQLLKNDAAQFQALTLRFLGYISNYESYRKNEGWAYIFFPPPSVLLYSQSVRYNMIIVAMLADDIQPQKIAYKNSSYSVRTLKGIITDSIKKLDSNEHKYEKKQQMQLQMILDNLPKFRQKWLEEYKLVEKKRSQFEHYLIYSTQRMGKMIHKTNFIYINKKTYIIAKIHGDLIEKKSFDFEKLSEEYQNDKEIILEALEWTNNNTAYTAANIILKLNSRFKKDTEVILQALSCSNSKEDVSRILEWVDPALKHDKEFVQSAAKKADGRGFNFADKSLKQNKPFALECIQKNPDVYQYIDESLKKDPLIVVETAKNLSMYYGTKKAINIMQSYGIDDVAYYQFQLDCEVIKMDTKLSLKEKQEKELCYFKSNLHTLSISSLGCLLHLIESPMSKELLSLAPTKQKLYSFFNDNKDMPVTLSKIDLVKDTLFNKLKNQTLLPMENMRPI